MSRELKLTWLAKIKQWRKRRIINGKRKDFYLGTGQGKLDLDSYDRALAKWNVIEASLDAEKADRRLADVVEGLKVEERLNGSPEHRRNVQQKIKELEGGIGLENAEERGRLRVEIQLAMARNDFATVLSKTKRLQREEPATPKRPTLGELLDQYLADQTRRYEHGQKVPSAPQSKRIGAGRLMGYRHGCKHLRADWGNEPLPADEATLHALMKRFQAKQHDLLAADTIMPNTYNERIKLLRHFLGWLHDNYHITGLPRGTKQLCATYDYKSTAKALSVEVIKQLWAGASDRVRTYIALALNCGYYAVDIANLERKSVQDGYIIADRHKTGVPTRYKLWDVTRRLLAQEMSKTGDLALVNKDGSPLLKFDVKRGDGVRWCKIENDMAALSKRLKIKTVAFSHFRDTSSTQIESINRQLTDVFDAHKDQRMARRYIDQRELDLDRMFKDLDAAIDELEMYYGLTLEQPSGKVECSTSKGEPTAA